MDASNIISEANPGVGVYVWSYIRGTPARFKNVISRKNGSEGVHLHCAAALEFIGLRAYQNGGSGVGLECSRGLNIFEDCLLVDNGGAGFVGDMPIEVFNCTISRNSGSGLDVSGMVKVRNSIIWKNGSAVNSRNLFDVDFSLIEGGGQESWLVMIIKLSMVRTTYQPTPN